MITPLIASGADTARFDLTPASIVGAIAFWWRARAWARLGPTSVDDVKPALARIKHEEAALFGAAAGLEGGGQSAFLVARVELGGHRRIVELTQSSFRGRYGLEYSAGQGLKRRKALFPRNDGNKTSLLIELLLKRSVTNCQRNSLIDALQTLSLFGGLGARSRRGWGSVQLRAIVERQGDSRVEPDLVQLSRTGILEFLNPEPNLQAPFKLPEYPAPFELPGYSAFSPFTRIILSEFKNAKDSLSALDEIIKLYRLYRAWGYNGGVVWPGQNRREDYSFKSDRDWMLAKNKRSNIVVERTAFGLPLVFRGGSIEPGANGSGAKQAIGGRRASPLFFTVKALERGSYVTVTTFLDSTFLPSSAVLKSGSARLAIPNARKVISEFFEWMKDRSGEEGEISNATHTELAL